LQRLGLIEWDSRKVKIRDWDAVAKIGDFSNEYLKLGMRLEREPLWEPKAMPNDHAGGSSQCWNSALTMRL
jgi:hypothetical protein